MRSAPLHDGTADTAEFDCGACGNRHPRVLPDDDGVAPEARGAATRMGGLFLVVVALALLALAATALFGGK
jgi:hypothetical protein